MIKTILCLLLIMILTIKPLKPSVPWGGKEKHKKLWNDVVLLSQAMSEANVNFSSVYHSLDAILKVLKRQEVTK